MWFPSIWTIPILGLHDAARMVESRVPGTGNLEETEQAAVMEVPIAGTHPVIERGELFNAAHLFTPNERVFGQKKVHLTQTEKGTYQMARGHGFYVYHTDYVRLAILVCYDLEFPEAARVLAEAGAQIISVPSCTDERQGFCRVRYCAQARASENQIYSAMAGTVGNLFEVPCMATRYGQAAILTPSDYFARDGIAAEGTVNQEQMVIADLDLDRLEERRVNGTVLRLMTLFEMPTTA